MKSSALGFSALMLLATAGVVQAGEDIILADFEGATYGAWQVTGEAFGPGPAQGALMWQGPVSGYLGKGLADSIYSGDGAIGTLTSPSFKIERKYLNFLVGGGGSYGLGIELLVDGTSVRSSTGVDDEKLAWDTWDVSEFQGRPATIRIFDHATGAWGHINVDQIVLSDTAKRELPKPEKLYDERFRPQFHFTAQKYWLNDPNGLVFYKGLYHLFFQYDPQSKKGCCKAWGHAVSPDLVHWTEREPAILPDKLGDIWSGSAVIDGNNTSGFQRGDEKPLVCFYTSAGFFSATGQPHTQSLAYSCDGGQTFEKYAGNPVLPHISGENRDPKVFWHAPSQQWIMALYLDDPKAKNDYGLFGSPNLKDWTRLSTLTVPGGSECPDFFEIPVEGENSQTKWVFWAANNSYVLGSFDGKEFRRETDLLQTHWGTSRYAAQTFNDIPPADGRRIQIAWVGGDYADMPFSQQMSFPVELTLRKFPEGLRLCAAPVKEIERLRDKQHSWHGRLSEGQNPLADVRGELFDLQLDVDLKDASELCLNVRGVPIQVNRKEGRLTCLGASAPLDLAETRLRLRVLVDRASIEVYAAQGRVTMVCPALLSQENQSLRLSVSGGDAQVETFDVWELKSSWNQ